MAEDKKFLKALKGKFDGDPNETSTNYYCFGGWEQSPRKKEFNEYAEKLVRRKSTAPSTPARTSPKRRRTSEPFRVIIA